jgi:FtsH-binding integral membrane protein
METLRRFFHGSLPTVCLWLMALGLFGTSGVALWIGLHDVSSPVSLAAQFLGIVFFLAGLAGLAGLASLVRLGKPLVGKKPWLWEWNTDNHPAWQIASVFAGAAAGSYVDLTITAYSLGYQIIITWIFTALALLCLCFACVMLRPLWKVREEITPKVKGFTISAALLGLVAQFWYLSIYTPDHTPIGMDYTFAIGSAARSGTDRLVEVNLTIEDVGSVPALSLASILVIRGISYSPNEGRTILDVLQPYGNDGFFFPNDIISYDFLVRITEPGIDALNFQLSEDFARTPWLTLGQERGRSTEYVHGCMPLGADTQTEWYVEQSYLRQFAQGAKVLYSDYCRHPKEPKNPNAPEVDPFINVGIDGIRGGRLVNIPNQNPIGSDLGILHSFRNETLLLG